MKKKNKPPKENPKDINPQGESVEGKGWSFFKNPFKKGDITKQEPKQKKSEKTVEVESSTIVEEDIKKIRFIHLKVEDSTAYTTLTTKKFKNRKVWNGPLDPNEIRAYIPGTIVKIYVQKGDKVVAGQKLLVLEAMKMRNNFIADSNGIVKESYITESQHVAKDEILLIIECVKD